MAIVPIKVPGVGESITEGILARWLKPAGSAVKAGEPLFELETDKTSQVVNAPAAGTLAIDVAEGTTVEIGATVGKVDSDAAPTAAAAAPAAAAPAAPAAGPAPAANGGAPVAPAARRVATEAGVDAGQLAGSGRGGLVTKGDVIGHLESRVATPEPAPAAPAAKPAPAPAATPAPAPARVPGDRSVTRQRMSGIRQKIATRLVEAQHTAAILTTFNEVDMSRVMDLRAKYKDAYSKKFGMNLGFMSFFVKASIEALKAFPAVNGRIEGTDLVLPNYYDIGVAVSTERGLMVPILRDADQLNFAGIEKGIADYAKKARDGTIAVSDLQGGTFTITNGGVFGSLLSTPILNAPQSAILGMHSIQKRPVAVDYQVVIRPMMYLALSYDHRMVDGREAVSFLVRIKECIENPERMLLDI